MTNVETLLTHAKLPEQDITPLVAALNKLVVARKFMEALDQFYHEHVITVENENLPTIGLEEYRNSARRFVERTSNYSAQLMGVIICDTMSVVKWRYTFDHQDWGHWDREQLSVQRWQRGKIVHERHHYQ